MVLESVKTETKRDGAAVMLALEPKGLFTIHCSFGDAAPPVSNKSETEVIKEIMK